MKFHKFFKEIHRLALYDKSIDNKTLKIFMNTFYSCLSPNEIIFTKLLYDTIDNFTMKQETIDTFIDNIKVKELENTLNELKYSQPK